MKLGRKSAVITGGAMGIGKAIAQLFSSEGCRVVIADVNEQKGARTQKEIEERGGSILFIRCDVARADEVRNMVQKATSFCGSINILVNNAGIWRPGRVTDLTEETWDQVLNTNLKGNFLVSKEIIPHMQKEGGGSIINIASVAGLVGSREASAYNASKGGIVNLTRGMALDFAKDNIRVNCICPGLIDTAQGDMVVAHYSPGKDPKTAMISWQPIARIGIAPDVAKAALYFASDESPFATGSIFVIDGGLTAE
jgi:NAD(P)-dependent dehydrogenase (short-subunit alcohol dehydrogenase family)